MRRATAAALVLLGAACAGAPPIPAERLSQTEAEIRAAQEIGAEKVPQAKLHLQEAREQLEAAKTLQKSNPEEAARRLELSRAQAELANALTREETAVSEAEQAKARLAALRKGQEPTGGAR